MVGLQTLKLANSLALRLRGDTNTANKRIAAMLLADYCRDVDDAVLLLCDLQAWRDALTAAYKHKRDDLVETVCASCVAWTSGLGCRHACIWGCAVCGLLQVIQPAAMQACSELEEAVVSKKQQFKKFNEALIKCRQQRAGMTVDELLNADGLRHLAGRGGGGAGGTGGEGVDLEDMDDSASMWSEATYVMCRSLPVPVLRREALESMSVQYPCGWGCVGVLCRSVAGSVASAASDRSKSSYKSEGTAFPPCVVLFASVITICAPTCAAGLFSFGQAAGGGGGFLIDDAVSIATKHSSLQSFIVRSL